MREDTYTQKRNREAILDVGLVIFIQPKGSPQIIRYKTAVVGWKTDHLVIIEMPILNGVYVNLADGCTCIVRYIYCGNAYGFETKVLRNINDAKLPLIYLSYPKSVEKISLRRYNRIQTQIPAFIEVPIEGKIRKLEGNILDLSVGGCLLDIGVHEEEAVSLDIDNRVKISFTLVNSGEYVEGILAVVKRVQKTPDNTMAGMQFIDLSPDMLAKIRSFCESLNSR